MITREEVQVLQAAIAMECALIVPYAAAEAVLYAVENYWLKQIEESIMKGSENPTCGLANPGPVSPTLTGSTSPTGAAAASQKCQSPRNRRGNAIPERQHLNQMTPAACR
jgi:hypothetical protein